MKTEKSALIRSRFSELGLTQKEAAARVGIMPQALGNYLKGERNFGLAMAQKWSDAFGFNLEWLLTGAGPVLKGQQKAQGTNITVGDFNISGRDTNIGASESPATAKLKVKVATLENEIKHLNDTIAQLKDQLKDKERTIGILMKTN